MNFEIPVLASTARTATLNSGDQSNLNGRGLHLVIDVTAGAAFSIVPKIQAKDQASGKWYDLLVGAAITATGTTVLKLYPGLTAAANLVANDVLPVSWRLRVEHGDATSVTYSAGASLIS